MRAEPTIKHLFSFLLLAAILLCSAGAQTAGPANAATSGMAIQQSSSGIDDFSQVTPYLYRGGQPSEQSMRWLKQHGFDIIVNMRAGHNKNERRAVEKLGMEYVALGWHCPFPKDKIFARFLKLLEEIRARKSFCTAG